MLPAPLNFTGGSCLASYRWLGSWAAWDPQEGDRRSQESKLTSSGSAATSSHRDPVPKPRLAPRLQTLPAVPFPGLLKVLATKMPLAWEELELARKKKLTGACDSPRLRVPGLVGACWGRDVAPAQQTAPMLHLRVYVCVCVCEAWVGGPAAFVLLVGK